MFGSIYHKEALTSALLFEIILRLHQVQIKEDLILYVIHIVETSMICMKQLINILYVITQQGIFF